MSSGYSFDAESVKRISRGIRRIEGMPDQVQGFGTAPVSGPGGAQVRTPATLPANYDGAQPLFGKLIDRDRDGNLVELADAYILGANNARLEINREYLGRMERVYTGSNGSAVLYRVQTAPAGSGIAATGRYAGGLVRGQDFNSSTDILLDGSNAPLTIRGAPWGMSAASAYVNIGGVPGAWKILLQSTDPFTLQWTVFPFITNAFARFFTTNETGSSSLVQCSYSLFPYQWNFFAIDFLRLVPATGIYKCVLALAPGSLSIGNGLPFYYSFQVINCRPFDITNSWLGAMPPQPAENQSPGTVNTFGAAGGQGASTATPFSYIAPPTYPPYEGPISAGGTGSTGGSSSGGGFNTGTGGEE